MSRISRAAWLEVALVAAILVLAGFLRTRELDRFIASDELRWTCRSINFHAALVEGDWARTFQVGHPGVLTMWAGALALPLEATGRWRELCETTEGGQDLSKLDDVGMEGVLQTIAPLLFRARRGVAFATLAALALIYFLARWRARISAPAAVAGLAMLAFDPFLVAHSRVLHLDALVALLSLAAVVALPGARPRGADEFETGSHAPRDRLGMGVAGSLAGLAILQKASGLVLGPFVLAWSAWRARRELDAASAVRGFAIWGVAAAVTFALLWPAMWVAPVATVAGVLTKAADEGGAPHESGNYFLGAPVEDPGPLFYPVAAAFRLTPSALLGLALAAWLALRGRDDATSRERALAVRLLAWAAFFTVVMTFGPKKFDRYLLPALSAVDLAGGVAVAPFAAGSVARRLKVAPAAAAGGAAALVLVLQAVALARAEPYPLAYYNPLLGGASGATRTLLVGWGEGYDLAADCLNRLPGAEKLEASARGVSNFAPLFRGRTRSAPGYRPGTTDYVVLYISQVQRRRNEALVDAYHARPGIEPLCVGEVGGVPFVWVYPNATVAPARAALDAVARPGDVLVAGGETVLARHYDGPLELVPYWGHWGEAEMREALARDFPAGWMRAWVVRYPGADPEVALDVLDDVARRGETRAVADGAVELTPFERDAP